MLQKQNDGRGWEPVTSSFCQKGLAKRPDKIWLSCKAKQLCTALRRARNRQSHRKTARPSRTLKKKKNKACLLKAPINSQEFCQSHGPRLSLLGLGISEVVLSSLVLRVGLQQARSISKAAEKGDVLHVQERKDRSVQSFLQRNEKSEEGQGSVRRKDQG